MSAPKRKFVPKALLLSTLQHTHFGAYYADAIEALLVLEYADKATALPASAYPTHEQAITWTTARVMRQQAYERLRESLEAERDFIRLSAKEGTPHGDKSGT